ncbi:threonine synthase [Stappia sp. F7233]|uniref:Threonine synthase n=1 Tax=Stappia albiluteola TaxID=2758565 RepID=A0A839A9U2_9HYPH|nr:threonine synthase [Stappia albiluteola]MBA5775539.1 threonine synthase [Stappia albiluteola]
MKTLHGYKCIRCGCHYPTELAIDSRGCPACYDKAPANLCVAYHDEDIASAECHSGSTAALPSLWRYAHHLPCPASDAVSLGEGLTPLVPAPAIGSRMGLPYLFIKDEGRNPTWSHKDRFSSVAVSVARMQGAYVVATASSGNAGASLAAYAARAGLTCIVATFAGATGPMLAQIRKMGAIVVPFANKADRWDFIAEGVKRYGWFATSPFRAPVIGSHPAGIEGYKTLAYEIVEQMRGAVPDWCVLPVCYGDALAGIWQGFRELHEQRTIARLPRLVAAEVHGSLTAALAGDGDCIPDMKAGFDSLAVSIGATRSTFQALNALRQSDGLAVPVGNSGLITWQEDLAVKEGIFAELASVAPFVAIEFLRKKNVIAPDDRVVAVVTASGLKDIDRSLRYSEAQRSFTSVAEAWRQLSRNDLLGPKADHEVSLQPAN